MAVHTLLRRVVVTGLGAVSPLGTSMPSSWSVLTGGLGGRRIGRHSRQRGQGGRDEDGSGVGDDDDVGITTLERALHEQGLKSEDLDREITLAKSLPCQVAAPVRGVAQDGRTARFVQFALLAGREAAASSGLDVHLGLGAGSSGDVGDGTGGEDDGEESDELRRRRDRSGCSIGVGMSSTRGVSDACLNSYPRGTVRRVTPHFVPLILPNSASGRLSLSLSLRGPCLSASTACAAGAHAIGGAARLIQSGDADVMFAGGAEAAIDPLSVGGFCRLRALSTGFNDDPKGASRPFDSRRDGFVMGEGAAVLVLEELEHAKARGANILCELRGYGLSGDAHHVTSPDPAGGGASRAMLAALRSAGLSPGEVDYVNAHATSTPVGDNIEAAAVGETLVRSTEAAKRDRDLLVSSTKGATGHLLGAAGGLEAAFTVLSVAEGIVPHTENLEMGLEGSPFRHIIERSTESYVQVAMSNSFGFGGTNASLVFAACNEDD